MSDNNFSYEFLLNFEESTKVCSRDETKKRKIEEKLTPIS
jgi:hypothetical protein